MIRDATPGATQFVVYGTGCIGICVGILLAHYHNHAVTFLGRDSPKFRQLQASNQLSLSLPTDATDGPTLVISKPSLTFNAEEALKAADVIFIATKRFANPSVCEQLLLYAPSTARIVLLQNGLNTRNDFSSLPHHLVESVVNFNVTEIGPGHFRWSTLQRESSLVLNNSGLDMTALVGAPLSFAHLNCYVDNTNTFLEISCGKFLVNMVNAPNALAGVDLAEFIVQHKYRVVWASSLEEALSVFAKMGVKYPRATGNGSHFQLQHMHSILRYAPEFVFHRIIAQKHLQGSKTSMLQDLENICEETEVDFLSGKVVELGLQFGVETPVNLALYRLVKKACAERIGSPKLSPLALFHAVGLTEEQSSCAIS